METCDANVDEVDDEEFLISIEPDSAITAFRLDNKKGVKFLPKNLLQVFPDLTAIQNINCSVISVGNQLKGLKKLRYLSLTANEIENIADDAFVDLVSLEYLSIGFNRIKFLAETSFQSTKNLKVLFLMNNKIQILHPTIFSSLVNVEQIYLDQNKISALPANIFENATNLKEISFLGNKLESLPAQLFKNNLKLEKIYFSINKIEFVDTTMFDHLPNLELVDFESNLCIDGFYDGTNFETMKTDFERNCNENSITDPTNQTAFSEAPVIAGVSSTGELISLRIF